MATAAAPTAIPWPTSSFPGADPQESAGRLINVYAEPLGSTQPAQAGIPTKTDLVWRSSPGLSVHAVTSQTNYRGGLIVANFSYEIFNAQALTVDIDGNVNLLGNMPGTRGVSIARNNNGTPNVIAVDIDNGAFRLEAGPPASYNAAGILPQPKSVCFQDGYLFFGIADRRLFATDINALTMNALCFTTVQAKSSDTLMRTIAFSGLLFVFCSSATEVWQDTAQPYPAFPYSRMVVMEYGLLQENAIAGFEDGFGVLHWVAQDFGVYQLVPGSFAPVKVSSPDLDRLIETAFKAGNKVDAGAYIFSGRKMFVLSSPDWSWEFNLATQKWNERQSLLPNGSFGRWRGVRGHPAFGKWLLGDTLTGNMLFVDPTNRTEVNNPLRCQLTSAPVENYPNRMRISRADFEFTMGVGRNQRSLLMPISGAVAGTLGIVRLTVNSTAGAFTGDICQVIGVTGTVEANGNWTITVIDATHLELQGCVFAHAYVSGGTATDITPTPEMTDPKVQLEISRDGGANWSNPWIRALGKQGNSKRRVTVLNCGFSGATGVLWRWTISAPIFVSFMSAKQASDPREY